MCYLQNKILKCLDEGGYRGVERYWGGQGGVHVCYLQSDSLNHCKTAPFAFLHPAGSGLCCKSVSSPQMIPQGVDVPAT